MPPGVWLSLGATLGMAAMLAALLLIWFYLKTSRSWGRPGWTRLPPPEPESPASLADLRGRVNEVSGAISDAASVLAAAASRLAGFQARLDEHSLAIWQAAKDSQNRHLGMAGDLLLLLDHLERPATPAFSQSDSGQAIAFVLRRLEKILDDAEIVPIPVRRGEPFDPSLHKPVDRREDELPQGTVLEVARRGYLTGCTPQGGLVLRRAEVILSSGPPAPPPEEDEAETPEDEATEDKPTGETGVPSGEVDGDSEQVERRPEALAEQQAAALPETGDD